MERLKGVLGKCTTPFFLVLLFLLAVLLPSIVLSMLALRAADREALHIERSLESALLSEVNLAAHRVADLLGAIEAELVGEASEIPSNPALLSQWEGGGVLTASPFLLVHGRLSIPDSASSAAETLRLSFGAFLEERAELPVYDHIAGVYRKELNDLEDAVPYIFSRREDVADTAGVAPPAEKERLAGVQTESARYPGEESFAFQSSETPEESPSHDGASLADEETGAAYTPSPKEEAEREQARRAAVAPAPAAPRAPLSLSSPPLPKKLALPGGAERQMAESRIVADSVLREEVFKKAEEEGFELLQRNVAPVGRTPSVRETEKEPSKTVARGKRFEEVRAESLGGFLPRLSDDGIDLLFWSSRADGTVAGFLVDVDVLKDRIAGVLPEILTDTRILTVLDERGEPLLAPEINELPDWRRPFVAREISPLLPRWEAGAWLADPTDAASRARFAARAVWLLVGALFLVILSGGALILWMLSSEMRRARRKTTFVANVSHELKTPLTSIRLFAEMLLSGRQKDEERRKEYLRTMVSEAERLSRLVENVLAFSRGGGGGESATESFDLSELARETLSQLEPALSKNGFLCSFSSEGPSPVRGDPERLRQVLMNLLSNAEKYSGDAREIGVRCGRESGCALVDVADRGPGVPSSQREKIFQEFFRGDDSLTASKSGAGLGLSIARSIARRHGGDVTYAPRRGGGSVFSLRIPLEGTAAGSGQGEKK